MVISQTDIEYPSTFGVVPQAMPINTWSLSSYKIPLDLFMPDTVKEKATSNADVEVSLILHLPFHPSQRVQLGVAQEMFKESPSLTREQKALILGFMAGSRG